MIRVNFERRAAATRVDSERRAAVILVNSERAAGGGSLEIWLIIGGWRFRL